MKIGTFFDPDSEMSPLEKYIMEHSEAQFSHGICPDRVKLYHGKVTTQAPA